MACKCEERPVIKNPEAGNIRVMAVTEARLEKRDYIIYKYDGTIYYEAKSCWEKSGGKGVVVEYIYYTESDEEKQNI